MTHPGWVLALALSVSACAPLMDNFSGGADYRKRTKPIIISSPEEFFLKSDQLFRDGRYRYALRQIRRIYQEASDPEVEEEALFLIALILSFGDNPNRNYAEARNVSRAFLKTYPESKRRMEVEAILLLLKDIRRGEEEIKTLKGYNAIQEEKTRRLEEDIRKIKEIDLQLEEQKKELE
jgi:outer membrane protein assembly factor BamD (BamD/ComL family)